MDIPDMGKYFKKGDQKFEFLCPTCGGYEGRNYMPLNICHCHTCNKSFTAKENLMADMFSLAKKEFKDIADVMCDRWTPKTAFIYETFAVFEFYTKEQHDQMRTYIDSHTLMFDGLDFESDDKTHLVMTKSPEIIAADAVVAG